MQAEAAQVLSLPHPLQGISILHVVASAGRYGAEAVIAALTREQNALGLKISVAIISDNLSATAAFARELEQQSQARVAVIPGQGIRDLLLTKRLAEIVRHTHASVIHSHGYKSDILCSRIRIPGIRRISTLHGWTTVQRWSRMAFYQSIQVRGLREFDAVVAVHDSVWHQHPALHSLQHQFTIPNGIACDGVSGASEDLDDLRWLPTDKPVVVVAGRLSREKGQLVAIEAISLLKKRGVHVALICAGQGPDLDLLKLRTEALDVSSSVFFPGYVKNISGLLKRAQVVLIPSYREGLPIVLLEAMRDGVPVVASAIGGMLSVLDYGGVGRLVTPGSVREVAGALEHLLRNTEDRRRLSEAGRNRFLAHYSATVMAREYLEVYQSATGQNFARPNGSFSRKVTAP